MLSRPSTDLKTLTAAVVALGALALSLPAAAQQPAAGSESSAAASGEAGEPGTEGKKDAPAWCEARPPMNVVMTYDRGKNFNLVTNKALKATDAFVDTLCPGDVVRVSEFGLRAGWLTEPIVIEGDTHRDKILKAVRTRARPNAPSSVNELTVKLATGYWEEHLTEGQMPVLAVFTDTIESDAPRTSFVVDFDWNDLPNYFDGRFMSMITVLDRRSTREQGSVFVTGFPQGFEEPEAIPSGGTTTYTDVMETFIPEPEPEVTSVEPRVIIKPVEVDRTPKWLAWLGTLQGSLTAGGIFFALGLLLFAAGRRSKKRKDGGDGQLQASGDHEPHQVTLVLRDNLRGEIVQQETRLLSHPLRVAPASNADFVIPGPYAFEVLSEGGAEAPMIRGANMLGIEVLRSPDRRLTLAEGETLTLKSGDRVNIGAGHEVEVQL